MVSSNSRLCGLIGWPVRHSLSPAMHNAAFAATGLDGVYLGFEVPPERLHRAMKGMAALGFLGCNLTVPHKETARGACGRLDPDAQRFGAVNTLTFEDGTAVGHNTDAAGFLRALQVELGCDPQGARALVLGAGGVARAVVGALMQAGADVIAVAARTPGRAEVLLDALAFACGRVVPWTETEVRAEVAQAELVVSCLPPEAQPLGLEALPARAVVLDVAYERETALLRAAHRAGARAAGGLEMLVQQGALSFELWTRQAAPIDIMRAAAQAELAARRERRTAPEP
ncbi:MAG: shikimate dehydrogenase [Deltaproteobacteria bacterium]|nr:shikimate dehydrogenase [Deltaproteobacteria bacterium]